MWYAIVFVVGFACGWAFFKHRADIKAEAKEQIRERLSKYLPHR